MLKSISSVLFNKYLLSIIVFALIMLFLDKNDIFTTVGKKKQLQDLHESKVYYEDLIKKEEKELRQLKTNPNSLEKYAREKYLMKKDNEDIFIVPDTP